MRAVTILRWGVFIIAVAHGWQAIAILSDWSLLRTLPSVIPPSIRLLMAAVWFLVWIGWFVALRRSAEIVRWGVPLTFLVYTIVRLIWVGLSASIPTRSGWTMVLFWGLVGLGYSIRVLRPSQTNAELGDSHQQ